MTAGTDRPVWTCHNCGRSFANRNQAHACQSTTVGEYLAGKSDRAVGIYEALELAGDLAVKIGRTTTIQTMTTHVDVDRSLGYAEDDGVDVFITGI